MSDIALAPPNNATQKPIQAMPSQHQDEIHDAHPAATRTLVIYRTAVWVRIWHWINALSLFFLLVSGLQIFDAHPSLYWGQIATFDHPILAMRAFPQGDSLRGVTFLFGHPIRTTGLLGASEYSGHLVSRGFPSWMTIPGNRDLEAGRRWHFFFAWIFAINGALYFAYMLFSRHLKGDLWPSWADLQQIPQSVLDHIRFKHPQGEAAAKFNVLQKLAYLAVLLILLPLMILTGLTMSPGMDAALPVLPFVFGGRQSARTMHFICAWTLVGFFAIHIFEVLAAGVFNEMRSIVTGRFTITVPAEPVAEPIAETTSTSAPRASQ